MSCERTGRSLFRGLSLSVQAGDLVEVRGKNGSGKSRLLRILAGVTRDWSGKIERRETALYIGHENGIHPKLTVRENLEWLARLQGSPASAVRESLSTFSVAPLSHRPCETLSVGQQRRVALSRLAFDTSRLWLLDEPTNSLDSKSEARFWQVLDRHLQGGGAAIIATHASHDEQALVSTPAASRHVIEIGDPEAT